MKAAHLLILAIFFPGPASAQVENFRITEIDPDADQVEIQNTGPAHTTSSPHPFCHRFNYATFILPGTSLGAGEYALLSVSGLNDADTDLWLYTTGPFSDPGNLVHGAKYGPAPGVGRTGLASGVGLWPSADRFAPSPPAGATLAWDGFGFEAFDWYVDETPSLGVADIPALGTVPAGLEVPTGVQDFESLSLGDEVVAIQDWPVVNGSVEPGRFTVRSVNDVLGVVAPRNESTRWLRIHDQDDGDVQNRFYSNTLTTTGESDYSWTFWVNLEKDPPIGSSPPRLTVQHGPAFANAWGIEFSGASTNLIVTGVGGPAASAPLYSIASPTGVGDWVLLRLAVNFKVDEVTASVNEGPDVSLPIALDAGSSASIFRLCYRGEGAENVMTMLLDDVELQVEEPVSVESSSWARIKAGYR